MLGLTPSASVALIRAVFRSLALQTHPDKLISRANASAAGATAKSSSATLGTKCGLSGIDGADAFDGDGGNPAEVVAISTVDGLPLFHMVKEASELLLDPYRRAAFDAAHTNAMVREVGSISDEYSLLDDFQLVSMKPLGADTAMHIFQLECRCGGVYEVVVFPSFSVDDQGAAQEVLYGEVGQRRRCECESCSLVVEVVI